MKQKLVILIAMLFVTTYAHAGITQIKDNNVQVQGQAQAQKAIANGGNAKQGQLQGQVGINKNGATGTGNSTDISQGGDDIEVISLTIPATPSTKGKDETSIGSPWGYINQNEASGSEKIEWYSKFTNELRNSGHMTDEEYLEEVKLMKKLAKKYVKGSKIKKIPVIGLLAN